MAPEFQDFSERQVLKLREAVRYHQAFAGSRLAIHLPRRCPRPAVPNGLGDAAHLHGQDHRGSFSERNPAVTQHLHALDARNRAAGI